MSVEKHNIYSGLKRIFHEPSRMAIISVLCRETNGITFNDLKGECDLTFGNLSSHLKILQEAKIVSIQKDYYNNKPRTIITITESGREQFIEYLRSLEEVLKNVAEAVTKNKASDSEALLSMKTALQS